MFEHVEVKKFYIYNDGLRNSIEGVTILVNSEYINVTEIGAIDETVYWISEALPEVFETTMVNSKGKTNYFINNYNFVLTNSLRLWFRLAKKNDNPDEDGGPRPRAWDRVDGDPDYKDTFTGNYSGYSYTYTNDGFQGHGSYCKEFDIDNLADNMLKFVNDYIIGLRMFFLSIEFVTFEASNYFYTYNSILFEFTNNREVKPSVNISSFDVRKYYEWYDWIRFIFELAFIITIIYMIYNFIKSIINKLRLYAKWEAMEIKTLSPIEIEQRQKNEPEIIRKFKAVFSFFTLFEVIFYLLSIIIFIMWIVLISTYSSIDIIYDSSNRSEMYNKFYNLQNLFYAYKIILSMASIWISFNLLQIYLKLFSIII